MGKKIKKRKDSPDLGKRKFLKGLITGAGIISLPSAVSTKLGEDIYVYLKNQALLLSPSKPSFNCELLFGNDPKCCGIIQGNSNQHLIEKMEFRASRYVNYSYQKSSFYHQYITGVKKIEQTTPDNPSMQAEGKKNLLILGGPVSSPQTRDLCGYANSSNLDQKPVPIFQHSSFLPFGFYCGNEHGWGVWGEEKRIVKRWHDDKTSDEFPLYGIVKCGENTPIAPPIEGNTLIGDMLMVIRVPNPHSEHFGGYYTIIGGMHGYSLEAFYKNIKENMNQLSKIVDDEHASCFQALIPARIKPGGEAVIDWQGWGNWRFEFVKLDPYRIIESYKTG